MESRKTPRLILKRGGRYKTQRAERMWVVLLGKQLILLLFHKRAELNSRISLPRLHLCMEVCFRTSNAQEVMFMLQNADIPK